MKKMSAVRFISVGAILTAIAVILQSAPVFLPLLGLFFSPISTLPIAVAAFYNISLGITVFFSSALILTLVSVQETIVLLSTTGLLGIVIGILLNRKGILVSILFSSIILSLGIIILTYALNISVFGNSSLIAPTLLIFLLFSLIYSSIWNICLRKFFNYLIRINLINIL